LSQRLPWQTWPFWQSPLSQQSVFLQAVPQHFSPTPVQSAGTAQLWQLWLAQVAPPQSALPQQSPRMHAPEQHFWPGPHCASAMQATQEPSTHRPVTEH